MNAITEQLKQIAAGSVWDGNLVCKSSRDSLVKVGYVERFNGWNIITTNGFSVALNIGLVRA
jgi:hypothetical protein